jgi:hypothetical protein
MQEPMSSDWEVEEAVEYFHRVPSEALNSVKDPKEAPEVVL